MGKKSSGFPKKWAFVGLIAVIVLAIILWYVGSYNSIISADQDVKKSWANVETQYQRRIDLIPNIVNTVKGLAGFEQSVLTQVTELRTKWMQSSGAEERVQTANKIEGALKTI